MFGFGKKKCEYCGKPVEGAGVKALGLTFCCEKDRDAYAKEKSGGKEVKKGEICEYC